MRLLFDLLHPAHVHLFRRLIARVGDDGGEALVLSRHKDVTLGLLDGYGIAHRPISRFTPGLVGGGREFLLRTARVWAAARRFRPDALLGTSLSIGLVGRLIGRPSLVWNEDDREVVPLFAKVAYPLASHVVTPQCLAGEDYGARHLTYPGYHELAYLHPSHFVPDPAVPRALGLEPDEPYFLLRLVALKAHHDTSAQGLDPAALRELVELLAAHGRVLITSEAELQPEFQPYRFPLSPDKIHDVLAFADLYVGDSQTMTAEAAVLGVPSLRCNTFVGAISYLEELEHVHGLTRGFQPDAFGDLLAVVREWLPRLAEVGGEHAARRARMLERSVDVADWQWKTVREIVGDKSGRD